MLLALDTATRTMSLALHDGHQVLYERTWHTANNHTIELAPAIRHALQSNYLTAGHLTAVAVAQGPGSFTGLRIGMGVAKGLAAAQNLRLVAVPTLAITAAAAPLEYGRLVAVLQAGRGRLCVQRFSLVSGAWQPDSEATIMTWTDVITSIDGPTGVTGEIDEAGSALLGDAGTLVTIIPAANRLRRAGYLAQLAWERLRAGTSDDPMTVTPIYLHQPGAAHP